MLLLDLECLLLCISSTIFLPMVTLWQPLKNKNLLRTSLAWIVKNYPKRLEPVKPDLENSRFLHVGFYCMQIGLMGFL